MVGSRATFGFRKLNMLDNSLNTAQLSSCHRRNQTSSLAADERLMVTAVEPSNKMWPGHSVVDMGF